MLSELGSGSRPCAHEPVGHPGSPPQSGRVSAAKPQWRMWLLNRFRAHWHSIQLPEFSVEDCPFLCPEGLHYADGLGEVANTPLRRPPEEGICPGTATQGGSDNQPTPTEDIERA